MTLNKQRDAANKSMKIAINNLHQAYSLEMKAIVDSAFKEAIATITLTLSGIKDDDFNFRTVARYKTTLNHSLGDIFERAADKISLEWTEKLKNLTLLARISTTYLGKISQPPWKPAKLNLLDGFSLDEKLDPRKGAVHFIFSNMVNSIMKQIQRAALNNESPLDAIRRVQKLFDDKKKHGLREAKKPQSDDSNDSSDDAMAWTAGPVSTQAGFFTPTDIEDLYDDLIETNGWEYRQYDPAFSDEALANNRELRALEQMLAESAIAVVSDGQLKAGTDLENVDDFKWFVSRPGVCKCCDARSGLTMSEISDKIDDDYGDTPPPLHPNCRCSLAPVMNDKFKDDDLEDQGVTWDPDSGALDIPDDVKTKYRTDLSLPDFVKQLKRGDYGQ